MPIINYRGLMVKTVWLLLGLGLFETVRVFINSGVPFRGPLLILSTIYPFYLVSKMEVRTNDETDPADSIPQ